VTKGFFCSFFIKNNLSTVIPDLYRFGWLAGR